MADYAALRLDTRLRRLYPTHLPLMTRCHPGEVIVRVAYAGICHTDLAILQSNETPVKLGEFSSADGDAGAEVGVLALQVRALLQLGVIAGSGIMKRQRELSTRVDEGDFQIDCEQLVLGHEISGIVSGIGDEVNWLCVGDKVAVNPNSKCERCAVCLHEEMGAPADASVGVERDGGWAEFCVVPQSQLHLLPSDVPLSQGVLCESLSCVAHAWDHVTPLPHSARIAVLGTDLVGCLTASLLHVQGYPHVTLCESAEAARHRAHSLGLGYEMITHNDLGNKTFDLAIDCTGDALIQQEAANALGFGGHLLIFRSNSVKDRLCLSPFNIFTNELKVTGSLINPYAFGKALTWASVLGHRYLDFNKLGVVSYPLKEYQEALETAKSEDAAKVVFEFDVSAVPTP